MNQSIGRRPNYFILSLVLLFPLNVFSEQEWHAQTGMLEPYRGEPPQVELDEKERDRLEKGGTVFKNLSHGDIKRGVIVFRVAAPAAVVWSVIKDFNSYPEWIDGVDKAGIYKEENGHTYVHFEGHNFFLGKLTWYVNHAYPEDDRNWGTWTLDYNHVSDFEDSVGFWRVQPVRDDPGSSDVIYSADIKFNIRIPSFIERIVVKMQIKKATHWVRKQAEARTDVQ